MESAQSSRHECAACFRQFSNMEYLTEHMKTYFHSQHEPMCPICKKHFRFYESLREHLIGGPSPKTECAKQFSERGCMLCLRLFRDHHEAAAHSATCRIRRPLLRRSYKDSVNVSIRDGCKAIALHCKYVGGGKNGSVDICARVCLVDEGERVIWDVYIKPKIPVTDYRHHLTGIRPENLKNAIARKHVRERIEQMLYNGEKTRTVWQKGGKARLLIGHNLDTHLSSLGVEYPAHLLRDTSKYVPLLKRNYASYSLKDLSETISGYDNQHWSYDPFEDCVAAMRLYREMRNAKHYPKENRIAADFKTVDSPFKRFTQEELEQMSPQALLRLSTSDYYCWCLDLLPSSARS